MLGQQQPINGLVNVLGLHKIVVNLVSVLILKQRVDCLVFKLGLQRRVVGLVSMSRLQ